MITDVDYVSTVCQAQLGRVWETLSPLHSYGTLYRLAVTGEGTEMQAELTTKGLFFFLFNLIATTLVIYSQGRWSLRLCESGRQMVSTQKPSDFCITGVETEQNPRLDSWRLNVTVHLFPSLVEASSLPTVPQSRGSVFLRPFSCVKFYVLAPHPVSFPLPPRVTTVLKSIYIVVIHFLNTCIHI